MSAWIVREEIEHINLLDYRLAADDLLAHLKNEIGKFHRTDCPIYGDSEVPVKYFLWVKTLDCARCGEETDLFPGYLVADDTRHPKNVLVCPACGELNEIEDLAHPGKCCACRAGLLVKGPAGRGACSCQHCGHKNKYPRNGAGPLGHRLFAIEYVNPTRKKQHKGRFFKKPDKKDFARVSAAEMAWKKLRPR
jgi:hypothetical protein